MAWVAVYVGGVRLFLRCDGSDRVCVARELCHTLVSSRCAFNGTGFGGMPGFGPADSDVPFVTTTGEMLAREFATFEKMGVDRFAYTFENYGSSRGVGVGYEI